MYFFNISHTWVILQCFALQEPQSDERFHVELHFSPGAYCAGQNKEYPAGRGYRPQHGEKKQEVEFIY